MEWNIYIYVYIYICIYGMIYSKKQTMHSLVAKHINYWHPHGFFPVPGRHSNILVPKIWGTKKSLHALDISHQKWPSLDDFLGVKKCWRSKKLPFLDHLFWVNKQKNTSWSCFPLRRDLAPVFFQGPQGSEHRQGLEGMLWRAGRSKKWLGLPSGFVSLPEGNHNKWFVH